MLGAAPNPTPRAPDGPPGADALFPPHEPDDRSSYAHRQLIGYLGLSLPWLLVSLAGIRPMAEFESVTLLPSVSAYYYTGGVAAFVGVLCALAVFFFTYQGYANEARRWDRWASVVAGTAALGVAFFPTAPPMTPLRPSWWTERVGHIHLASAMTLFAALIFFALVLFPRSRKDRTPTPAKRARNAAYYVLGGLMAACVVWALVAQLTGRPIFWAEALALEFFAISWLVKGRADWTVTSLGKRALRAVQRST
jgi:hypothetical protein